ncbi:MAG: hypothetical protein ACK5KT_07040 [Dysgonomonas sp.]
MKNISYILAFIIVSLISCSGTVKSDNPRVGKEKVAIIRFDKDVYNYLQQPDSEKEVALKEKYPILLPAFGRIAMENSDAATFFPTLKEYFSHPMLMNIYKSAIMTFDDVAKYEDELSTANALIAEYFQGKKLPQLAMHVSGFRENVIIINNLISISSDKYLGSDYIAYQEFFQPYERQQMQAKYIVRDYLKAWLMSDIIKINAESENLLSAMITEGKVLYALSLLLPEYSAEDIIGYTIPQLSWCKQNEKSIWQKIVKQDYLYSADHMLITRLINDAPNSSNISKDAPGRIGCWTGLQIVTQYAKKQNASLEKIINTDVQTILKESKYNP